ncbi:MAG: hypothetical protein IT267_11645 [Saprospiraceae bacterium]|nr:hypothetical protein [Saprospiraceae bacterium]
MTTQNKRLIYFIATIAILLLIPLILMQFSKAVDWKISDFIVMGVLLIGTGLLCGLVLRKAKNVKQKIVLCGLIFLIFLIIWVELAVGILN